MDYDKVSQKVATEEFGVNFNDLTKKQKQVVRCILPTTADYEDDFRERMNNSNWYKE